MWGHDLAGTQRDSATTCEQNFIKKNKINWGKILTPSFLLEDVWSAITSMFLIYSSGWWGWKRIESWNNRPMLPSLDAIHSRNPKKFTVDTFSLVLKGMLLPLNQVPSFLFQPVYDLKTAKLPWHCPFCYLGRTSLASMDNSSKQRARRTSKISKKKNLQL